MTGDELTESQRVDLCSHIIPLIRSGLPIEYGLKAMASELPKRLARISTDVQTRLHNGDSLGKILGGDTRPESRSLSATVAAGDASQKLALALESWAAMHTARAQAKKRVRYKLVYPVLLILITTFSVGYAIHSLVPQYKSNLASIHANIPAWFQYVEFVHQNLIAWGILAAVLSVSPVLYFVWRRGTYDSHGWPRDPAYRSRLQAHASKLAEMMIVGQVPTGLIKELVVGSLGVLPGNSGYLDPACQSILDLLDQGKLDATKSVEMQADISKYLMDRSEMQFESQGRWIVTSVSIAVACVVGLSYVLVIYLPWVYLLNELKQIRTIR
jgi:hypothetical protein